MKRFIAIVICAVLLLCMIPVSVFAEGDSPAVTETNAPVTENLPTAEENATEGENSASTEEPLFTTEMLKDYVNDHFEEILVIVSLILARIYESRTNRNTIKCVRTLNNNSLMVVEESQSSLKEVTAFKQAIVELLAEYRKTAEEKKTLEHTLTDVHHLLKTLKLADLELGNEIAELLVLANIPNSVKDELYARHVAAVNAISEADKTEVISNDNGKETE